MNAIVMGNGNGKGKGKEQKMILNVTGMCCARDIDK